MHTCQRLSTELDEKKLPQESGAPKGVILELFCVSLLLKRLKRGFRRTELGIGIGLSSKHELPFAYRLFRFTTHRRGN